MVDYTKPVNYLPLQFEEQKQPKTRKRKMPTKQATERDFGDYVVDSAKWFGKEIVLDPLMWLGGMFSTPQYAITNLVAAPNDKKLSYIGQNLRHLVTLGIWKADEEAMTPPSTYMFGKQNTPFWSMDTAKRLLFDIVSDPMTLATGWGVLTKAGKFGGSVTRVAEKANRIAQKLGNKALAGIGDSKSLFRAIAKGEDVVGIAKAGGDDFAKEMQLLVEMAGNKGVQLQEGFQDFSKIFKSEDRAIDNLFDWYNKSVHLGKAVEAMGPEMGQQYLRAITKNANRFAQRQWVGLAFTEKNLKMGMKMKVLNDRLGVLTTKMSGTMPGRMLTGIAKNLKEWRGKAVTKFNDALHEVSVGTAISFGAALVPDQRILERIRIKHGIDPDTGKALLSMYELSAGKKPTLEAMEAQARRFGADKKRFIAAYDEFSETKKHMDNEFKEWASENGANELKERQINKAAENVKFLDDVVADQEKVIVAMRSVVDNDIKKSMPKQLMETLDLAGIKGGKEIALLSDDNIEDIVNAIRLSDVGIRDNLHGALLKMRDAARGVFGVPETTAGAFVGKTIASPSKIMNNKEVIKIIQSAGAVSAKAESIAQEISKLSKLTAGRAALITEEEATNAIKTIAGHFPHIVDPDTARRADFIHNMNVAKRGDDFFAVPNEPHLFVMSGHTRMFRALNEGAYNATKEAFGDSWNDEIARAVEDSLSVTLTAEESNLVVKNDKALTAKYLKDLEKIAPDRAEFLKKANWDPRGDITTTMADMLAAGDMTGIKTFFTEDPFFAVESWLKRTSYEFSTESATKAAVLHYAKFSNELSPEQIAQGDWLPVGNLYAATEAVVPEIMKQEWKDAEIIRNILNHHMGKGDDIYKAIGKMDAPHQQRFSDLLSRGLMDFNATNVYMKGNIVVPKDAIDYLSKMKMALNPGESGKLLRGMKELYSTLNKYWVMSALMRPAYHSRNAISSMFMNLQYGIMPWEHIPTIQTMHYLNPEMLEKSGQAVQSFGKKSVAEGWEALKGKKIKTIYGERDYQWVKHQMSKTVGNTNQIQSLYGEMGKLSPTQASRMIDKGTAYVKGLQFWAGGAVENTFRETAFVHFLKKGYTVNDAADMVKKIHYNYADLSYIDERIKNIFPFWAFVRKSIAGQLDILNNKSVVRAFELKGLEARRRTQLPEELMPEYLSDAIGIETYRDENGNPHFFMLGGLFPFAEINKLAIHPKKFINNFAQSLSPVIKEPLQQILNYDFFTESKIQQWTNQTGEYLGMEIPVRMRHAAMNIVFANEISRLMWKDKPGQKAPSGTEKLIKAAIGINLKPVDIKKQLARLEYQYKTQMSDMVANFKRTVRYGDSHNAGVILHLLNSNGYDTTKLLEKHLKEIKDDDFQVRAMRDAIKKSQI